MVISAFYQRLNEHFKLILNLANGILSKIRSKAMSSERYQKGIEVLQKTTNQAGTEVVNKLNEIHPGLGKLLFEFAYGDITSRPGLDLKTRQLINVVALTVLGHALPQLKIHVQGALNMGWTETEIKEAILQMAVYAGFPTMLNAMFAAEEVFEQNAVK